MADETTVVADSSSVAVLHPEEMNDSQRSEWLRSGTHPEITPKQADPAPAGDKKAASPTAEGTGKRNKAEDRKQELAAEIQALLKQRAELRLETDETRKAASQPPVEKKSAYEPKAPERPKRPDLSEFKTTAEYDTAMDKYDAAVEAYSAQKSAFDKAKSDFEAAQTKMEQRLKDSVERLKTKYPDALEASKPVFQALVEHADSMPQITWFLNTTEVLPDMLYALGGKFKLDEFIEMGKSNPDKAVRVLAMMERDILTELEKSATPKDPEEEKPAPRKVTQAPPPPKEVGGTAASEGDPLKSAVARRDFSSFANEANKRDIQRRTRGR